eukprot:GHVT01007882.1.p1 GENE.GHVT01007882.1~~GHVT01007882.1.p1  ORF type:complete len:407 (+),score=106.09 GHVT01007882.1:322-1542(+)
MLARLRFPQSSRMEVEEFEEGPRPVSVRSVIATRGSFSSRASEGPPPSSSSFSSSSSSFSSCSSSFPAASSPSSSKAQRRMFATAVAGVRQSKRLGRAEPVTHETPESIEPMARARSSIFSRMNTSKERILKGAKTKPNFKEMRFSRVSLRDRVEISACQGALEGAGPGAFSRGLRRRGDDGGGEVAQSIAAARKSHDLFFAANPDVPLKTSSQVFVRGLAKDVVERDVLQVFKPFGSVVGIKIDRGRLSTALVSYLERFSAARAEAALSPSTSSSSSPHRGAARAAAIALAEDGKRLKVAAVVQAKADAAEDHEEDGLYGGGNQPAGRHKQLSSSVFLPRKNAPFPRDRTERNASAHARPTRPSIAKNTHALLRAGRHKKSTPSSGDFFAMSTSTTRTSIFDRIK